MRVLDRYIVRLVCGHIALVMGVLLTLVGLFLFINEQGWVGVGRYGQMAALRHVLMNLPAAGLQFLPVAALIGSLLAMGGLARGSELTVMRAAGVSIGRICLSVFLAGLLLLPPALLVREWVAPPLVQMARETKAVERSGPISVTPGGGAWIRDGERILRADGLTGRGGAGILVFELGEPGQLRAVGRAGAAEPAGDGAWALQDYAATRFGGERVERLAAPAWRLETRAGPDFLAVVTADPAELSLRDLQAAVRHLAGNGQDPRPFRFAFWSGVAHFAAIPLAMLLAMPFLFGALRSAESGARTMLGLVLGLVYFIAQRMVESGTIAFGLDPLLLAWLPTALLAAAVALLLARVR